MIGFLGIAMISSQEGWFTACSFDFGKRCSLEVALLVGTNHGRLAIKIVRDCCFASETEVLEAVSAGSVFAVARCTVGDCLIVPYHDHFRLIWRHRP